MIKRILVLLTFTISFVAQSADLEYGQVFTLSSQALDTEREFYVRLPASYTENPKQRFPVLYLLHGQWDMLPAAATLALLEGEIPEFILVGIQSQGQELRPGEGEDPADTAFSRFVLKELLPHIQATYRAAEYKILSGHSNAGRFVVNHWLSDGKTFSACYAFSPSLDDGAINARVAGISDGNFKDRSPLIMTLASEGEHMLTPFKELRDRLQGDTGIQAGFREFPELSHSMTRHASLAHALTQTFAGWNPSYEVKVGGFAGLKAHYQGLTKRYGFAVSVPLELMQRLSTHYSISEQQADWQQAEEIVAYGIKQENENPGAFWEIADYLNTEGYEQGGKRLADIICRAAPGESRCMQSGMKSLLP
ncbi:alpha/beta hydrolase [Bowmanella dokdonensis]|uniref:Esterase n=1 Tax=Bowmanella dokdonensis TaxID=751969 RepID=A0A939DLU2_9ALTE|nr:alpha/beta hydrolase-fold protein [Bowmanella dokdonensis]MBN7824515.1 esterase [Bowmanella dokdonensis]